jgi:hypothetical protein
VERTFFAKSIRDLGGPFDALEPSREELRAATVIGRDRDGVRNDPPDLLSRMTEQRWRHLIAEQERDQHARAPARVDDLAQIDARERSSVFRRDQEPTARRADELAYLARCALDRGTKHDASGKVDDLVRARAKEP